MNKHSCSDNKELSEAKDIIYELSLIFDPMQSKWDKLLLRNHSNDCINDIKSDCSPNIPPEEEDSSNGNNKNNAIIHLPRSILKLKPSSRMVRSCNPTSSNNVNSRLSSYKVSFSTLQIREFDSSNAANQHYASTPLSSLLDNDTIQSKHRQGFRWSFDYWWNQMFFVGKKRLNVNHDSSFNVRRTEERQQLSSSMVSSFMPSPSSTLLSTSHVPMSCAISGKVGYGSSPRDVAEIQVDDYEQFKATGEKLNALPFMGMEDDAEHLDTSMFSLEEGEDYDYDGSHPVFYIDDAKSKKRPIRSYNDNSRQTSPWLRCCREHGTSKCCCPPLGLKRTKEGFDVTVTDDKKDALGNSSDTSTNKSTRSKSIITGRVLFQRPFTTTTSSNPEPNKRTNDCDIFQTNDENTSKSDVLNPPKDTLSSQYYQNDLRDMQRPTLISGKSLLVGSC